MGSVVAADEGVVVEVEADEVIGSDFSADSNGTRRYALTDEERDGLAKLFESVDADRSGGVDYLELASFLRAMSELDDDLAAAISPRAVYELFARSDDDGDGRLSDGEFGAALVAWSAEELSDADERRRRRAPAGGRHPPWEDSGDASGGGEKGHRRGDERGDDKEREWEWAAGVASAACVLCVTGHPRNCGPPSPPGCEVREFRTAGIAVAESRAHAATLGTFLRRRGLTHE